MSSKTLTYWHGVLHTSLRTLNRDYPSKFWCQTFRNIITIFGYKLKWQIQFQYLNFKQYIDNYINKLPVWLIKVSNNVLFTEIQDISKVPHRDLIYTDACVSGFQGTILWKLKTHLI